MSNVHLPLAKLLLRTALLGALFLVAVALPRPAQAASGTVSTCNWSSFNAVYGAAPIGGTITFNCDGTIATPSTIVLVNDAVLDANGNAVIFDGGHTHRLFRVGPDITLELRGITVHRGKNQDIHGAAGAGVEMELGGELIAIDSSFTFNRRAAAIRAIAASVSLTNCTFSNNDRHVYVSAGSSLTVTNTSFESASSVNYHGVIITQSSDAVISGSRFSNNNSTALGVRQESNLELSSSTFSNNHVIGSGAALRNDFAAVRIKDSAFIGNHADFEGGAIVSDFAVFTEIDNTTFSGNSAGEQGGAIWAIYEAITVTRSTFAGNTAPVGGGIYLEYSEAHMAGSVMTAGAQGENCYILPGPPAEFIDNGYNLSDDESCTFSGLDSANGVSQLRLGALSGVGAAQAHIPEAGSVTSGIPFNATVDNNGVLMRCNGSARDQLGNSRPLLPGDSCSSGAAEWTWSCALPTSVDRDTRLSACITLANANGAGLDTITVSKDIVLGANLPEVSSAIRIQGTGHSVSGNNARRVFRVASSGDLTLDHIGVQDGNASSGGGLRNDGGKLTLVRSTVSGNVATAKGGGVYNKGDTAELVILHSTISGNSAATSGGGIANIDGTLAATSVTLAANSAPSGSGITTESGARSNLAGVMLGLGQGTGANCAVSGGTSVLDDNRYNLSDDGSCGFGTFGSFNNAVLDLDGIGSGLYAPGGSSQAVGGIPDQTALVNPSGTTAWTCDGTETDQLDDPRPGVANTPCTVGALERAFVCPAVISNGHALGLCIDEANSNGAGLDTLILGADFTLSKTLPSISSEISVIGNGYVIDGAGTRQIFHVSAAGDFSVDDLTLANGQANNGGAIEIEGGTVTVSRTTFLSNNALSGGAIFQDGGRFRVTNSTFSENSATINGGAILSLGTGGLLVTSSTFYHNSSAATGAIVSRADITVRLAAVLLEQASNGPNCEFDGTVIDNGYNLSSDSSCNFNGTGSVNSAALHLRELRGGVHVPPLGISDAIGVIPNGVTVNNRLEVWTCDGSGFTDQRSQIRPVYAGLDCTSGAVEVSTHHRVGATALENGSISPAERIVEHGAVAFFSVTPDPFYTAVVTGGIGCGGSMFAGSYRTEPIFGSCDVIARFELVNHTVTATAGSGGSVLPSGAHSVTHGDGFGLTIVADVGHQIDTVSGCGGNLSGNDYSIEAVIADCTVDATFSPLPYTVTPSVGSGGSLSPDTPQTVLYGNTTVFSVIPDSGFAIDTVSGCGGSLAGTTFTTGAISANCTVSASFSRLSYTVTPSAGSGGSLSPSTPQTVLHGDATAFSVIPDVGYAINTVSGCGGSLAGTTFTTGAISADCTVSATFERLSYTVTPSAGPGGSLSPSTPQTVLHGDTTAFSLIADTGYALDAVSGSGGGLSPNTPQTVLHGDTTAFTVNPDTGYAIDTVSGCDGSLAGSTYTTSAVVADCTVTATFSRLSYTVTPSAGSGGSFGPSTPQTVLHGDTTVFTLMPDIGYAIDTVSGCDGSLAGSAYTTSAIVADCTVTGTFIRLSYAVSPSAGTGGSFDPATPQTVLHGDTTAFSLIPDIGYAIESVSGCDGSLAGSTYSTSAIVADCTVTGTFIRLSYTVSPSAGTGGSFDPATPQTVLHGDTTVFTLIPDTGYAIDTVNGCGGSLAGTTFTTGAISADCTVTATFSRLSYTVTPSAGSNGNVDPATPQAVLHGDTVVFTLIPDTGYDIDTVSGCDGSLAGSTYSTAAISADCAVSATFRRLSYTVSPSVGTGGSLDPATPQTLLHGDSTSFTVIADSGYSIDTVSGCSGSLAGTTFSIAAISADCTVSASFIEGTNTTWIVDSGPVRVNQPALFTVSVSGTDTAPADGLVLITASSGESCNDAGPGQVNGNVASYSCSISFVTVGPRTLAASFSDSSSHSGSDSATLPLTAMLFADLSVSASDGQSMVTPGAALSYLIAVRNAGPDVAAGSVVLAMTDPALVGASWQCTPLNGASCPAASGSGMIAETVNLPPGGGLDYLYDGVLGNPAPATVVLVAEVDANAASPNFVHDPDTANNQATDIDFVDGLFGDGFE